MYVCTRMGRFQHGESLGFIFILAVCIDAKHKAQQTYVHGCVKNWSC